MNRKEILKIKKLRKSGKSFGEIAKELNITKSQATYYSHLDLEELDIKNDIKKRYEENICNLPKKCTNINQILKILGKKGTNEYYKQVKKILDKYNIDTSHFINGKEKYIPNKHGEKLPISEYLISGSTISSTKLRDRIINENLKEHKCERCGRTEWEGEIIPLQLHHINGIHNDNRIENLQLLCPNCHALTDTYCRNKASINSNRKCLICGKKISRKAKMCKECFQKLFKYKKIDDFYDDGKIKINKSDLEKIVIEIEDKNKRESKCPSKEELLDAFKLYGSFRAVGKKYGVTDKAVFKWCEKLSLPTKAIEMRNFLKEIYGKDLKWDFTSGNIDVLKQYYLNNFKRVCLINNDETIEKIYTSLEEIKNDGFKPKGVYMVCKGELKTHHHRKFKFLE